MNPLFLYSLFSLLAACIFSTILAALRTTGDAGLKRLIERRKKQARQLERWEGRWKLLCKTARFLLTLCAVSAFILLYVALQHLLPQKQLGILFLFAMVYMVVARVVPHVLAESYADRISLASLPLISSLTLLLFPLTMPMQWLEDTLLQHALNRSDMKDRPSPEDEIKMLIEETDEDDLEAEERDIIRSVFEFGETITREIMTPRVSISGLKDNLTINECITQVRESRHSRFPVYHDSIDDVIGVIHVKDLLKLCSNEQGNVPVKQIVKKISFVPAAMPINDLMQLMKKNHEQLMLVIDEYGGTSGLVSMEDIIEELVGEIEDEYDLAENDLQVRPDGTILVNAHLAVSELNEHLGAKIPESDEYDSLGGYIFSELGHIPKASETLTAPGYLLRIQSATHRQIQVVQLTPQESA